MEESESMDCSDGDEGSSSIQLLNKMSYDIARNTNSSSAESHYYQPYIFPPLILNDDPDDSWTYVDRRQCQEIIPGLYLGPYATATRKSKTELLSLGITHIICVRAKEEARVIRVHHMDSFKYLVVELEDSDLQLLIPAIKKSIPFLDECFRNEGKALIHGNAGLCRSPALMAGYLMWHHGCNAEQAIAYLTSKRLCISIRASYITQLEDFQIMVHTIRTCPTNSVPRNKRPVSETEVDTEQYINSRKFLIVPGDLEVMDDTIQEMSIVI